MAKKTRISDRDHQIVEALFDEIENVVQRALYGETEDDPAERLREDIEIIVFRALQMKRQK